MRDQTEHHLSGKAYALPLRREVSAIMHIFRTQAYKAKVCLDIGFTHAGVSRYLRDHVGTHWMTVEPTVERCEWVAGELEEGTVFVASHEDELPFEDRQFDALVLAHGALPYNEQMAARVIRECHRVIKTGGLFLMTVESRRKFGLANMLNFNHRLSGTGGLYTEEEIFRLLTGGFDVLGFRYSCRFWVQLVRQWADRRREKGYFGEMSPWLRFLYGLAHVLDFPLFLSRGYQMTVCGRRKGWRGENAHVLSASTPVSDAVLFNPKYSMPVLPKR